MSSNCTISKSKKTQARTTISPSVQTIINILNYSKVLQVKKVSSYGVIVYMNN